MNEFNYGSIKLKTNASIRRNKQVFKKSEENKNKLIAEKNITLSFIEIALYKIITSQVINNTQYKINHIS